MDPQLIRANIALFQGKRAETRRLLEEYVTEQADPQAAQREPMILWLNAQAQPRHDERIQGLQTLIEQTPPDSPYYGMAQTFLQEEARYTGLLEVGKKRRGIPRWQIIGALVLIALVVVAVVLLSQPAPVPEVIEVTEEPTVAPSPTVIVQNTPVQFAAGTPLQAEYDPLDGILTILSFDPSVRFMVNEQDILVEPLEGTTFYAMELEFRCLLPVCNSVPEAELSVRLNDDSRIRAASNVFVAGQPRLEGGIGRGFTVRGWVVFQLPRSERPSALVVSQFPAAGSDERPPDILVPLPQQ